MLLFQMIKYRLPSLILFILTFCLGSDIRIVHIKNFSYVQNLHINILFVVFQRVPTCKTQEFQGKKHTHFFHEIPELLFITLNEIPSKLMANREKQFFKCMNLFYLRKGSI